LCCATPSSEICGGFVVTREVCYLALAVKLFWTAKKHKPLNFTFVVHSKGKAVFLNIIYFGWALALSYGPTGFLWILTTGKQHEQVSAGLCVARICVRRDGGPAAA
jgi:hypothetical protein